MPILDDPDFLNNCQFCWLTVAKTGWQSLGNNCKLKMSNSLPVNQLYLALLSTLDFSMFHKVPSR